MYELISIVVPVYNVENYLENCIESIRKQNYPNFELILVDDGSRDRSVQICDSYAKLDSRIKVFHNENRGANASRKFGVSVAKGNWIMFVDSDDTITVDCISLLYRHKDKADVIVGSINLNGRRKFHHQVTGILNKQQYVEALLLNRTSVGPVAKLFKKHVFNFSIWNENKKITNNEDLMMLIFVASQAENIFIDNSAICYNYIFRMGSATSNRPPLSMWLLLFSIIENAIMPLFNNQVPSFFYLYCLHRLYDCVVLKGIKVDVKSNEISHIATKCSTFNLSMSDSYMLQVLKSKTLQGLSYRLFMLKVYLKRLIVKFV